MNEKVEEIKEETKQEEGLIETVDVKKPKKKRKSLKEFIQYIKDHEELRQVVMFTLFSMICGGSQFLITLVLPLLFKLSPALMPPVEWSIFHFDTIADCIGFLIGSVIGQILTYVLNRKKTFKSTNNLAASVISYIIMAVLIVFLQTYLGGVVTTACLARWPQGVGDKLLESVFNILGQIAGGMTAFVTSFLGNKFFVMRDWGKGRREKEAKERKEMEELSGTVLEIKEK